MALGGKGGGGEWRLSQDEGGGVWAGGSAGLLVMSGADLRNVVVTRTQSRI